MAQKDTTSTRQESQGSSSSMKFRSSLSRTTSTNEQQSKSRHHLTLPVPSNNPYPQSPAERYILSRSQMLNNPNDQLDLSPETPSSITGTNLSALQSPTSHAEFMQNWRQKQTNDMRKKQKHRYVYGPPPSPSSSMTFSSPMYTASSTLSTGSLSTHRNVIPSSIQSASTVKNDHSTERSKKNESSGTTKKCTAV